MNKEIKKYQARKQARLDAKGMAKKIKEQARVDSADAVEFRKLAKLCNDIANYKERRAERLDSREHLDYGVI